MAIVKTAAMAAALSTIGHEKPTGKEARRLAFDLGVSCLPKIQQLKALLSPTSQPAPDCCGEDAYTLAENEHQSVLAVADGVGGWRSKGIDPSAFSRSLMAHLEAIVMREADPTSGAKSIWPSWGSSTPADATLPADPHSPISTSVLLKSSFWRMLRSYFKGWEKPFGSSTVCIVSLDKESGELQASNLGDSGYLLLRDEHIVARSQSQQHRFNAPYQLMLSPQGEINDCSEASEKTLHPTMAGDIVVVATDGLWDNLFEEDIISIVRSIRRDARSDAESGVAQRISHALVQRARIAAEREDYESPFCREGRKHGMNRLGGKLDDITVLVGIVRGHTPEG